MSAPADDTQATLPSYAELTQTQGWAPPATGIAAPTALAATPPGVRYEETDVLGLGGMGKVVLARDARLGRSVALKVLRTDRPIPPDDQARFLREAQVQGQLEHPSIVPVYDIDQRPDGSTFFTMRRVHGRTLHAILEDARAGASRPTLRELLQAFATVCLTVDYAHTRGVVHRDLKPANIMLGDFGEVYVLDWGIARILAEAAPEAAPVTDSGRERLSYPGTMMGTPLYMAPEQMMDPAVGPAADVWGLGALLFEILTLEPLRDPRAVYALPEPRPSVRTPAREVAPELETICVRAAAAEPADRYPSARALHAAVALYLEGDRALEQRRTLAAGHADQARAALARATTGAGEFEAERGQAMRELVRALALEPTNNEHVALLADIMEQPVATIPPEVEVQVEAVKQAVVRVGSRYVMASMLSWFLFAPVLFLAGLRRVDYVLLIAAAVVTTAGIAWAASRRRPIGRGSQCLIVIAMALASVAVTRLMGPMIFVPTMVVTWAIVFQAHPDAAVRRLAMVLSVVALVGPQVLELVGVFPASYAFARDGFTVLPQMTELPRGVVLGFLMVAHVGMALMPAAFIRTMRDGLERTQVRQIVQTWHFRRLGADLLRATR